DGSSRARSVLGWRSSVQLLRGTAGATTRGPVLGCVTRGDAPRDEEVDQADSDNQQEQQNRDGGCFAQVSPEEGHLPEEQNGGLELPLTAADATRGGDVEQPRLGEDLQTADGGRDDDEDQGRPNRGDRDRDEASDGPCTV